MLKHFSQMFCAATVVLMASIASHAADINREWVDFTPPAEIRWVKNPNGNNESALLFGDPSKPGPYVARIKWYPGKFSRPHFHPNDRFFVVISGTWWMGTGTQYDPDSTGEQLCDSSR